MKAELDLKTKRVNLDGPPAELADFINQVEGQKTTSEAGVIRSGHHIILDEIDFSHPPANSSPKKANDRHKKIKAGGSRGSFPEAEFIKLYKAGKPMSEIAAALKMNIKSMYNNEWRLVKAGKIKKRVISKAKKNPKLWTEAQLKELISLADSDEPLKVMGKHIGRPLNEVRAKLQELANKGKIDPSITALIENVTA